MTDRDRSHLHPVVDALLERHLDIARVWLRVGCIETARDEAAQHAAWRLGRDEQGNVIDPAAVVTNAPAGASYHGVTGPGGEPASLAYHIGIYSADGRRILGFGEPLDDAGRALYLALGRMGEGLGLTWGGRWPTLRDYTHFELRAPGMDLAAVRAAVTEGQPLWVA